MKKFALLAIYVVVSIAFYKALHTDFHPFSMFSMYNSFPNYAYVFYLKNERGETVFYNRQFALSKNADNVAHNYYAFFNHHHYDYGLDMEKPGQLQLAGKELLQMVLKGENIDSLNCDTLKLYRRFYFLEDFRIKHRDDLMYEQRIKP